MSRTLIPDRQSGEPTPTERKRGARGRSGMKPHGITSQYISGAGRPMEPVSAGKRSAPPKRGFHSVPLDTTPDFWHPHRKRHNGNACCAFPRFHNVGSTSPEGELQRGPGMAGRPLKAIWDATHLRGLLWGGGRRKRPETVLGPRNLRGVCPHKRTCLQLSSRLPHCGGHGWWWGVRGSDWFRLRHGRREKRENRQRWAFHFKLLEKEGQSKSRAGCWLNKDWNWPSRATPFTCRQGAMLALGQDVSDQGTESSGGRTPEQWRVRWRDGDQAHGIPSSPLTSPDSGVGRGCIEGIHAFDWFGLCSRFSKSAPSGKEKHSVAPCPLRAFQAFRKGARWENLQRTASVSPAQSVCLLQSACQHRTVSNWKTPRSGPSPASVLSGGPPQCRMAAKCGLIDESGVSRRLAPGSLSAG